MGESTLLSASDLAKRTTLSARYFQKLHAQGKIDWSLQPGGPRSPVLFEENGFNKWWDSIRKSVPYMPAPYDGARAVQRLGGNGRHEYWLGQTKPGQEWVYFIGCHDAVKIGYAANVRSRISAIRSCSPAPCYLLCLLRGGKALEGRLHQRFAASRQSGEWFRMTPELETFITEECNG